MKGHVDGVRRGKKRQGKRTPALLLWQQRHTSYAERRGRELHIRQLLLVMNTPAGAMIGHDDSQPSKLREEKQKTKKVFGQLRHNVYFWVTEMSSQCAFLHMAY